MPGPLTEWNGAARSNNECSSGGSAASLREKEGYPSRILPELAFDLNRLGADSAWPQLCRITLKFFAGLPILN